MVSWNLTRRNVSRGLGVGLPVSCPLYFSADSDVSQHPYPPAAMAETHPSTLPSIMEGIMDSKSEFKQAIPSLRCHIFGQSTGKVAPCLDSGHTES